MYRTDLDGKKPAGNAERPPPGIHPRSRGAHGRRETTQPASGLRGQSRLRAKGGTFITAMSKFLWRALVRRGLANASSTPTHGANTINFYKTLMMRAPCGICVQRHLNEIFRCSSRGKFAACGSSHSCGILWTNVTIPPWPTRLALRWHDTGPWAQRSTGLAWALANPAGTQKKDAAKSSSNGPRQRLHQLSAENVRLRANVFLPAHASRLYENPASTECLLLR